MLFSDAKQYNLANMSLPVFYQHLRSSTPFKVVDGCRDWPATEEWEDEEVLVNLTKQTQSNNWAHENKDYNQK